MISEINVIPQEQFNLFDIAYKHGGRDRTMMQKRTELIQYLMIKDGSSMNRADADFEKIMSVEQDYTDFFKEFLENYH